MLLYFDPDHTKKFVKDWIRLFHSGRYDMHRLKEVMLRLITNDEPLGAEWLDHALKGEWADHREKGIVVLIQVEVEVQVSASACGIRDIYILSDAKCHERKLTGALPLRQPHLWN